MDAEVINLAAWRSAHLPPADPQDLEDMGQAVYDFWCAWARFWGFAVL